MLLSQWLAEIPLIVGVCTGAVLIAMVYILAGLLFHRPSVPDVDRQ